jgi:hypothetical protein
MLGAPASKHRPLLGADASWAYGVQRDLGALALARDERSSSQWVSAGHCGAIGCRDHAHLLVGERHQER